VTADDSPIILFQNSGLAGVCGSPTPTRIASVRCLFSYIILSYVYRDMRHSISTKYIALARYYTVHCGPLGYYLYILGHFNTIVCLLGHYLFWDTTYMFNLLQGHYLLGYWAIMSIPDTIYSYTRALRNLGPGVYTLFLRPLRVYSAAV
jgi:hypothetical protein